MIKEIIGDYESFIDSIFIALDNEQIDVSNYFLDHLCYRVKTEALYNDIKNELLKVSTLLTEKEVNGRPIASFKFHKPIQYKNRLIPLIELPYPRENEIQANGLEHIEFVIDMNLESFIQLYPNINFNKKGLTKKSNPDVKWKIDNFCVKFHNESLEDVIIRENKCLS
jgi:predicted metalloenzyme YecM